MSRQRADLLLVERGFFDSRAKAQAAIQAGLVTANGAPVRKASEPLEADAVIAAQAPHPWVSRGGLKLEAGLDGFGIDPQGLTCLDLGASTGGFTQVLLARGARRVYAVDVGRGQLHPSIASDERVVSLEGTDARSLTGDLLPEPIQLVVTDVSFISLTRVLPATVPFLAPGAGLVALIKPQFEAGRENVGKGGIVRDEAVRRAACAKIEAHARELGFHVLGILPSPILGGEGNHEYLIGGRFG